MAACTNEIDRIKPNGRFFTSRLIGLSQFAETPTEVKQIVQTLQQQESEKSLLIGVSQLNEGGLILRVLGYRAELIQKLFEKIGEQLKSA